MKFVQLLKYCGPFVLVAAAVPAQVTLNTTPTRVLGQQRPNVNNFNPNLVEGRELFAPQNAILDTTVSPPILYVADTGNNRVLAWRNAAAGQRGTQADLVIGQRDLTSTLAQGPGTTLSTGLSSPTGLAVDRAGNLYVADSGNNRILRFPRPFEQTSEIFPDVVIGQTSFANRAANGGSANPTETGIASSTAAGVFRIGLAADPDGSLWVSDAGNNRVLRFPAASLNRNNGPANLVLGQSDFASRVALTVSAQNRIRKDGMNTPGGIALDSGGRLFVTDSLSRVLVFFPPYNVNNLPASRILGVVVQGQGITPTTPVNNITLGASAQTASLSAPDAVFAFGTGVGVVDAAAHRIVRYPAVGDWPAEATQFSPIMSAVIGQPDFTSSRPLAGGTEAAAANFNGPVAAAANTSGDELFVVDAGNHRVVRLLGATFSTPGGLFGQAEYNLSAPNLIEGREFFFFDRFFAVSGVPASLANGTGLAVDGSRLYVADTLNNRVLGFRDVRALRNGQPADIVIGQPDFNRAVVNFPSNDANTPSDTSLFLPAGVAVDRNGDLFVSDSGNGRVLRFPRPFDVPSGQRQRANLVLGQLNFTSRNTDASSRTMSRPFGLAFLSNGALLVADSIHSRVLLFNRAPSGDFANGQAAAFVFGQPDFLTTAISPDAQRLALPRGISTDSDDRLYIADTGKNRIVVFNRATNPDPNPTPALVLTTSVSSPHGVFVSQRTGEVWVANSASNTAVRFPRFDQLVLNPVADFSIPTRAPLGLTQDEFGSLFITDGNNRVGVYYPGLLVRNAANFLASTQRPLAPNTYASLGAFGPTLADSTVTFSDLPNPLPMATTLADTQVLINDRPANLHFVSPNQINFLTPNDAPTTGTADVLVVRPSTGQIIAAGSMAMSSVAPGLFTAASSGTGQLSALNQDNTVNSSTNPAPRGTVIQLFGTGIGAIQGAPPQGQPASGLTPGADQPGPNMDVIMGSDRVPDANITYTGLAPGLIGVWQVNVRIPDSVAPGNAVPVRVRLRSISNAVSPPQNTTIAVRQ